MTTTYRPSAVRRRATKADLAALDDAIVQLIILAEPPVTARQVFYMAAGRALVDKHDRGYRQILRRLSALRDSGEIPWHWIADNTRWVRQSRAYRQLDDALVEWQAHYRRDYWADQPQRLELWVESDSIASFLGDTVDGYGLPMYVCRGQASRTYIRGAVEDAAADGKPVRILYVGDYDPSGLAIDRSLIDRYTAYRADEADVALARIALTPEQIVQYDLEGNPAKTSDPNYRRFAEDCRAIGLEPLAYETEALPPADLRRIVGEEIALRVDLERWRTVSAYEAAERAQLEALITLGRR